MKQADGGSPASLTEHLGSSPVSAAALLGTLGKSLPCPVSQFPLQPWVYLVYFHGRLVRAGTASRSVSRQRPARGSPALCVTAGCYCNANNVTNSWSQAGACEEGWRGGETLTLGYSSPAFSFCAARGIPRNLGQKSLTASGPQAHLCRGDNGPRRGG